MSSVSIFNYPTADISSEMRALFLWAYLANIKQDQTEDYQNKRSKLKDEVKW